MNYDKVPELPEVRLKPAHRRGGVWLAGASLLLAAGLAGWWQTGRAPAEEPSAQKQWSTQIAELELRLENLQSQLAALPAGGSRRPAERVVETARAPGAGGP
jgi:hypothetical protein